MYCLRRDYFQFDPSKYSSIVDCYYDQQDSDCRILKLFDDLDSAKKFLENCIAEFRRFSYDLAEASVYLITVCDWYFDDDYYAALGLEKTFVDLELFEDVVIKVSDISEFDNPGYLFDIWGHYDLL